MTTAGITESKYLVTGATGRTGSHVVRKLVGADALNVAPILALSAARVRSRGRSVPWPPL